MTKAETFPAREDAASLRRLAAAAQLGRVLGGRWTLEEVLGAGGAGTVFAACHRNGRSAAVKVLHPELALHPRIRQRFLAEGYAANKVGHPGAVQILDDGEEPDGTVFLVMELLRGKSVADRFAEAGVLPVDEVVKVAGATLDVLASAHDRGILHRDVKPSNVFLTTDGFIKLLDFGAARIAESDDLVTRSGTTLGTPAFMAPELASGSLDEIDARTDIWAVGAMMFQLLTGSTVHAARSTQAFLHAAATTKAPALATKVEGISRELTQIVDRALAFEKADRWPNARAMRQALIRFSGLAEVDEPGPDVDGATVSEVERAVPSNGVSAAPTRQDRKRRLPTRPAFGAIAILLLLAFSYWNVRSAASDARARSTGTASAFVPAPAAPDMSAAAPPSVGALPSAPPKTEPTPSALSSSHPPIPGRSSVRSHATTPTAPGMTAPAFADDLLERRK